MSVYQLVLVNSFQGTSIFSLSTETLWFVAKEYGNYNLFLITLAALAGAMAAMCLTFGIGRLLGPVIRKIFIIEEEMYQKVATLFTKYGVYIFLFQMLPVVKILFLFAGIMQLGVKRVLLFMLAGRVFYYVYYIYILPMIPNSSAMM